MLSEIKKKGRKTVYGLWCLQLHTRGIAFTQIVSSYLLVPLQDECIIDRDLCIVRKLEARSFPFLVLRSIVSCPIFSVGHVVLVPGRCIVLLDALH